MILKKFFNALIVVFLCIVSPRFTSQHHLHRNSLDNSNHLDYVRSPVLDSRREQTVPNSKSYFKPLPSSFESSYSHSNSPSKRKSKNSSENLLEEGKELLKIGSLAFEKINKNDDLSLNPENNSTVHIIDVPGGVGVKSSRSGSDGSKVDESINITSSTYKSTLEGNSTESENVVQMQMEKKILDEHGQDRGFEEIKIVQKQRVKPISGGRMFDILLPKRKKRNRSNHGQHKIKKRSVDTDHFLDYILSAKDERPTHQVHKRTKRISLHDGEADAISRFSEMKRNQNYGHKWDSLKSNEKEHKGEMDRFLQLLERRIDDLSDKNVSQKELISEKSWDAVETPKIKSFWNPPKSRKLDPMHYIINVNISWNQDKSGRSIRVKKVLPDQYPEKQKSQNTHKVMNEAPLNIDEVMNEAPLNTDEVMNETPLNTDDDMNEAPLTVMILNKKDSDSKFSGLIWFFIGMTLLSGTLSCMFPVLKSLLNRSEKQDTRTYKLYEEGSANAMLEVDEAPFKSNSLKYYPKLQWQSENGDWLSEQETDFR